VLIPGPITVMFIRMAKMQLQMHVVPTPTTRLIDDSVDKLVRRYVPLVTAYVQGVLRLRSSQMMALSRCHSRSCDVLVRLQKGGHNLAVAVCRLGPETTLFWSYWRRHEPRPLERVRPSR
jgi:hypothetical protein